MRKIDVIFEDEYLIIVNKPPKLLVVPSPKEKKYTLTYLLNNILKERKVGVKAHPCHRLDKDTSGLIIYAKGKKNQQVMMSQFHKRKVKKRYVGFLQGRLSKQKGIIKNRIDGKAAITKYKLLEQRCQFSIVEIQPITGRKNQIRIHFKQIGHPLVGERRFAFAKDFPVKFRRPALHASELAFRHPIKGVSMNLKIPLANDMLEFLNKQVKN